MKLALIYLIILFLAIQSRAGTELRCLGQEGRVTVELTRDSFRPCFGPCPGSPERDPVVTVELRLANNKFQVSRSNTVELNSIEMTHQPEYQKQMTTFLNSDSSVISESAAPIFIKLTTFDAALDSTMIPTGTIKVSCKEVVQAPSFDVLK